jgi:hypothetical protein
MKTIFGWVGLAYKDIHSTSENVVRSQIEGILR